MTEETKNLLNDVNEFSEQMKRIIVSRGTLPVTTDTYKNISVESICDEIYNRLDALENGEDNKAIDIGIWAVIAFSNIKNKSK